MNTGSEHGDSVPDECFANPRLAEVYDDLEADREVLGPREQRLELALGLDDAVGPALPLAVESERMRSPAARPCAATSATTTATLPSPASRRWK